MYVKPYILGFRVQDLGLRVKPYALDLTYPEGFLKSPEKEAKRHKLGAHASNLGESPDI